MRSQWKTIFGVAHKDTITSVSGIEYPLWGYWAPGNITGFFLCQEMPDGSLRIRRRMILRST